MITYKIVCAFFILTTPCIGIAQPGRWAGPVKQRCGFFPIKPLSITPPVHSDMPAQVLAAYNYFDSIARTDSLEKLDSFFQSVTDIRQLDRHFSMLYTVVDYDATLFNEYCSYASFIDSTYLSLPGESSLPSFYLKKKGVPKLTALLLNSAVILRIKVLSVEMIIEKEERHFYPHQCIQAEILDTIKGMHLGASGFPPVFKFRYVASLPLFFENEDEEPDIIDIYTPASGQIANDQRFKRRTNLYQRDKEYIVFLETIGSSYDGTFAYCDYQPFIHSSSPGGAYEIDSDGNVLDVNNIFGLGTRIPVAEFIRGARAAIELLRNP